MYSMCIVYIVCIVRIVRIVYMHDTACICTLVILSMLIRWFSPITVCVFGVRACVWERVYAYILHILYYTLCYTTGQLPCVPIASSTTAYGRNLLLSTREYVESTYTVLNGYPHNAEVITNELYSVHVYVYVRCILCM